ncbi:TetR/AcrR family transcriptional regulator [Nocardioides daphniae]|uniref:TetR family transcriptional regulator n=1 Tax=Nocardioides daphniae TaxID=402297 RepID=A0A4P7UCR4_9ACTN|nr:TetR/AcrR family transcriptional regulator [Nocardioides daphniae]QCC77983.1 TetR/AcrR family transcriptional regulator [Nocardioides daphniae]GGD23373.1 TetR family transcriptional regulator [Nocardioides daphniae]
MAATVNGPDSGPDARRRLYDAAVQAFAEKGFHGTTTRDIASAAGMSPAALYVHHRSKEDLLHVISATGHAEALSICRRAAESGGSPTAQLEQLVVDFARFHCTHHTLARIVNYELSSLSPEHRAEIDAMRDEMDALARGIVEAGVRSGEFADALSAVTAAAVLSLGIDIARWYDAGRGWSPDEVAEHYRALTLRMVGAA